VKDFLDAGLKVVVRAALFEKEVDDSVLDERVGGEYVTFSVYVFMLRVGVASVRDVFRGCGLSSPSLALHHLEKLEGLGLVRRDEKGLYNVVVRKFGVLRFFHRTGRWLLPRSFFYMIVYAALIVASAVWLPPGMRGVAEILSAFGFSINLVETTFFLMLIPHRSRSRTKPFNN
jgi:hypothetical protein